MIAGAFLVLLPFAYMISTSLKNTGEVFKTPIQWIPHKLKWDNFTTPMHEHPIGRWFKNSLLVAVSVTLLNLLTCSLAGYSFAKFKYPGRNLLFLTLAAALAYRRGLTVLVTGVCETDFSGYPDCRDDTMKAMQLALSLGMDQRFLIDTPLMWIDKADTWRMAHRLGGDALQALIVEHTHTCYLGDRTHRHDWGWGCGTCPACALRARGWQLYRGEGAA